MQQSQRRYKRHGESNEQRAMEDKEVAMDFGAEEGSDSDTEANSRTRNSSRNSVQLSAAWHNRYFPSSHDDQGRQQSRVLTRPVLMATTQPPAASASMHQLVRTRPVFAAGSASINLEPPTQATQQPRLATPTSLINSPPAQLSGQSSVVAKKATSANQRRSRKRWVDQQQQEQNASSGLRPRSSSESSFSRIFFGWRRPVYRQQKSSPEAVAPELDYLSTITTAPQKPAAELRGKNLRNFSYADAKIYDPQSNLQRQPELGRSQLPIAQSTDTSRTKIWWTMETMGAVDSVHSNQFMLASKSGEKPTAYYNPLSVQADY